MKMLLTKYSWETSEGEKGFINAHSMKDASEKLLKRFQNTPGLEILIRPFYLDHSKYMIVKVKEI